MNLFIGAAILILSGFVYGRVADVQIILKERSWVFVGIITGVATLLTTAVLSGVPGFLQEGLDDVGSIDDPFEDYIFKPFFWIAVFGMIPAILSGIWFGKRVRLAGERRNREKCNS